MKKIILALGLVLLVAGVALALPSVAQAADLMPLSYQFPVMGTPVDNTFKATLDNTAKSVQTLAAAAGITWIQDGRPPQGALIGVETYDIRIGTANISTAGAVGVRMAVGSSWQAAGAGTLERLYFCNAVANDNAIVQIMLQR